MDSNNISDNKSTKPRSRWRLARRLIGSFFLLFLFPLGFSVGGYMMGGAQALNWWEARHDSTQQAPDPALTREAVVQVYAARAFRWRGAFGVHTWIAAKPSGADHYTRFEVMGWSVRRGGEAVQIGNGIPDGLWFSNYPEILIDLRGAGVDAIIDKIRAAAERYPHNHEYRLWPGPNSNTFTAYIGREVPELRLDLPPTAIGKDYIAGGGVAALSPSGTGAQLSLFGLAGLIVGWEEGVEVNLLGLTFGVDITCPALKLPGVGRLGMC